MCVCVCVGGGGGGGGVQLASRGLGGTCLSATQMLKGKFQALLKLFKESILYNITLSRRTTTDDRA